MELERVDEHSNLKRRISMIRIIRGNVTDSKLAAVPDRTNGSLSLSLSLNRGPSFFSLHFFTWPERERERSLNLGMAVFPGR